MAQSKSNSMRRLASGLLLSTALAVWSAPSLAQAQPADGTIPDVNNDGGAVIDDDAAIVPADNAFDRRYEVDLQGQNRVLDFNSFDVGADVLVDYISTVVAAGQLTAVNNIAGGNPSDIYGLIRSESNIDVWLINPDGITFGAGGGFSGASLLLSTLPFSGTNAELLTQLDSGTPSGTFTRTSGNLNNDDLSRIFIQGGATLNSNTGNMVLIGERVTVSGALTADNGNVVMVGAREVTFSDIGSPLSFSITEGVRIMETDAGISIDGDVEGESVVAAVGSRDGGNGMQSLMETVLSIEPNATLTATAIGGAVVLATDTAATSGVDTATIANDAAVEASIAVTGPGDGGDTRTLVSEMGGITILSNQDITITDAEFEATGTIDLSSANDLTASGTTIFTPGDVSLTAAADGINFAVDSTAIGSAASRAGTVSVNSSGTITLGDVTAGVIETVPASGILSGGELVLGTLDTTSALDVDATGDVTFAGLVTTSSVDVTTTGGDILGGGDVTATLGIDLAASGTIDFGTLTTGGAINVNGAGGISGVSALKAGTDSLLSESFTFDSMGDITLTGTVDSHDAIALNSGGAIDANLLQAFDNINVTSVGLSDIANIVTTVTGNVTINAGSIELAGATINGTLNATTSAGDILLTGLVSTINAATINSAAGLDFTSIAVSSGNISLTAVDAITGGDLDSSSAVTLDGDSIDVGAVSGDASINALAATGDVTFASFASDGNITGTATAGDIDGGDVNPGNAAPTGAAYFTAGGGDITLGDVNATELGNGVGLALVADSITLGDVTTSAAIDLVAANGNLTTGTLRTPGQNIELTADGDIELVAAFTTTGMGDPTTGNIGIYATGDIGTVSGPNSNPVFSIDTLSAGFDVAVRSTNGDVAIGDIFAGDDIVLIAPFNGGGTVQFGAVTFFGTSTADSDHATFVVPASDFVGTGIIDPGAPGTANSVAFVTEPVANALVLPPNPGARVFTGTLMGSDTFADLAGQRLAVAAQNQEFGELNNVSGDVIVNATNATFNQNLNINGNFIVTGENVTLGQNNQTRTQQVTGFIDITATAGDIVFDGDLTLQSNTDGLGADPIMLTATGDIGPDAAGSVTLIGGAAAEPSAVIVALGGNFTADVIDASSLSVTNGTSSSTQGDITIGNVTTDQSLVLRTFGGDIDVDEAAVTDAGASLTLAAGGAGQNVTSGTSLTTNGGNILVSAGGVADLALVTTSASVGIVSIGDTLISDSVVAGEDILILAGSLTDAGDIGAAGSPVTLMAGDDIRTSTPSGTTYIQSAITDGTGPDTGQLAVIFAGTQLATLFALPESFSGADIVLDGMNLLGPALIGSTEDALVLGDFTAGSASLFSNAGDIRIGDLTSTTGGLFLSGFPGSVSGLADGFTGLTGGSVISAPGDVSLNFVGGEVEVGSVTSTTLNSGGLANRITIGSLNVDSTSLVAVERLQIDSGTVTGSAFLQTTGGTPVAPSLTNSPPLAGFGAANLSAATTVTVFASSGAAQIGTVTADGTGTAIRIAGGATDVLDAQTTAATGDIVISAVTGQLTVGTANSAGALTLDKAGAVGELTATGALTSAGDLTLSSTTATTADSLVSTAGAIALTSADDTSFVTAQADNGAFASVITGTGDFTATSVTAQSVAITDGVNAWAPGNITIDTLTSEQSLALRTNDGTITVDTVSTSNLGASVVLAAGGAGQDLVSTGSITTNNGDLLLSAADMVDIVLASTSTAAPTAPTSGTLGISAGDNVAISDAVYAGEDLLINAGGDVGDTGNFVTLDAGDDIVVDAAGDVFLASAITDGGGVDFSSVSILNGPGRDANLTFGLETISGAQVRIAATNLSGDPVSGSGEDALIVRDLTAGSATLTANLGDIRIGGLSPDMATDTGGLTATAGDIDITATAGSVSSLTDGWVAASGGPVISAPGDIVLDVTGTAAIGSVTGAAVSNTNAQSLTIVSLDASSATLSAVDRLHIDSGTITGAANLTTTGGTATASSLTGSPPVAGYGWADVDAASGVTVSAPAGAVQINTVVAGGAGGITIDSAAAEILSAISAIGGISVTANSGQLNLVDANAAGDLLLTKTGADGELVLGSGVSTGGDVVATSTTNANITTVTTTTGDITITTTGGDIAVATASSGNDITLDASGNVDATTLTGDGALAAVAGADAVIGSAIMGGIIDVTAGDDIAIGSLDGLSVLLTAVGDVSGLADGASTETLVPGFARGEVASGADIAVVAGGNVQLGALDSGTSSNVSGAAVGVTDITAGTSIDVAATDGELTIDTATAGTTITLGKAGVTDDLTAGTLMAGGDITATSSTSLDLTDVTSTGGMLTASATGGDVTITTGAAPGDITLDASENVNAATLSGDSDLLVTAGGDGTVAAATFDGSITIDAVGVAGGDSLFGNGVTLNGFAVNTTTVDAGTGELTGTANGGDLSIATGTATGTIALTKTGDIAGVDDGITSDSLTSTGGDILLDSSTFVNIGASNAAGLLSITSPETIVAGDLTSDGSIAINTGGDAQLGDITTGASFILLAAGEISAGTLSVGEDIAALAGGGITIGDFTAGDNVTLTAGTTLDLGGGSTTGGGTDDNTYLLDLALAGTSDPNAILDGPADAADGDVLLQAPDDFALAGTISVAAADGTLTIRNLDGGSDTTSVGTTGGFEISEAEFGFLAADNVVVDSGDQSLALGDLAIDSAQSLQLLSTGDITLSGVISGSGTGTLQIGAGEIGADGFVDPTTLSTSITATTDVASIDFANGAVDLRAVRIVFGLPGFVTQVLGASPDEAADLLTDAGSQLYVGDNTQKVFLQADLLRVVYSDFALFQNTAFSLGGGAILNADGANSVNEVALELFSQGDDNLDSFAIFGEINGFTGRTAGVLPNSVLNIGSLSPRQLRVTQSQSRVNGCVIGSPDRGCLIVDLPPPEITTIDERQQQDLISTDDPSEFLNPLVGRGNEGLILDIAQIPVGIDTLECGADDPTCQSAEEEQ